jgi:hypothetical protein
MRFRANNSKFLLSKWACSTFLIDSSSEPTIMNVVVMNTSQELLPFRNPEQVLVSYFRIFGFAAHLGIFHGLNFPMEWTTNILPMTMALASSLARTAEDLPCLNRQDDRLFPSWADRVSF